MKNTPAVNGINAANGHKNGEKFTIKPGEPIPVSTLIEQAKKESAAKAEAVPQASAVGPETAVSEASKQAPSRAEQVEYWNNKARKIQLVNSQLQGLKTKRDQLAEFSFTVDRSEDSRFAKILIVDDSNVQFECRNHALVAMTVDFLKEKFAVKIEEKETEFIAVAEE